MKFWFFALLLPGVYAFTDSMLERGEDSDQLMNVLVKGIADDGQRVRVSVMPVSDVEGASQRETVELCSNLYQPVPFDSEEDLTAKGILKRALEKGQEVRVQYQGSFSRCIAEIQMPQAEI